MHVPSDFSDVPNPESSDSSGCKTKICNELNMVKISIFSLNLETDFDIVRCNLESNCFLIS